MLQEYDRFPQWLIDVEEGEIWSKKHKKFIGSLNDFGYLQVPTNPSSKKVHRIIWECVNGEILNGFDIHHIDGNKLNNSIYNLELVNHKKHVSEHKKGVTFSEEHRRKLSETHKGKIISEDTKEKISKILTNNPKLSKQVVQYTLEGELVKIWCSANECERNGFSQGHVCACCQGKRNTHKGFIWKYYEEQKDVA